MGWIKDEDGLRDGLRMESGKPSHRSGVSEVVRLLGEGGKGRDVNQNLQPRSEPATDTAEGQSLIRENHLKFCNPCKGPFTPIES